MNRRVTCTKHLKVRQNYVLCFHVAIKKINSMENVLIKKLRDLQSIKKSPHFMESECPLSFSQEPSSCHPERD